MPEDSPEDPEVVPAHARPVGDVAAEEVTAVELALFELVEGFRIETAGPLVGPLVGAGASLFEALVDLRRAMEPHGWLLCVAGARGDVYPSPMSLAMGDGRRAYRLIGGTPARTSDLVDIFAPAEGRLVTTVAGQEASYRRWISTLGTSS